MPATPDSYAARIINDAEALLAKVHGDLQQAEEFYRSAGIDPQKVLPACEPHMGPRQKEELARLLQQDQEEIQREVDEGMARIKFSTPSAPTGGARKPRPMV
jgi:F0F1-type ATP synthase membrane subunit b/b'